MGVNFAEGGRTFSNPDRSFANLDPGLVASLVTATADFALLIDRDGIVVDVAMRSAVCPPDVFGAWIGRSFVDTVTSECRLKAKRLLGDVDRHSETRREINHPIPGGSDLPVSYTIQPLTRDGGRIALGRDLRAVSDLQQRLISAQLACDHELVKTRDAEGRYRILFETGADPHLIVDPATRMVVEANALGRTGLAGSNPVGTPLERLFAPSCLTELDRLIAAAYSSGRTIEGSLVRRDDTESRTGVSLRFFRHLGASRLSLRLLSGGSTGAPAPRGSADDLFTQMGLSSPDAIAVFDAAMRLTLANRSYLDLVQVSDLSQIEGTDLSSQIGHRGVEARVLKSAIDSQGSVRSLSTEVMPAYGVPIPVEIGGTVFEAKGDRYYGFVLRRAERSGLAAPQTRVEVRPANDMIGLVGQMPLRDIVRDTTDIIERLCIEAALELTGDNRASAAELLGISRQALYTKLRRFGIIGEAGEGR